MADVLDVFIDKDILVHMRAGGTLDAEAMRKRLAKLEVTSEAPTRDQKALLRG